MSLLSIQTSFLGRWFGKYKQVSIFSDKLKLLPHSGINSEILFSSVIDFPILKENIFSSQIILNSTSGVKIINWMKKKDCRLNISQLQKHYSFCLESNISQSRELFNSLTKKQFLRDSSISLLESNVFNLVDCFIKSKVQWSEYLSNDSYQWLNEIKSYNPLTKNISFLRQEYEANELSSRKTFYDQIESNPLTEEQRLSVIRNNDRNLVLAAAGTGKTSVMVAKALDLIDSGKCIPNDILILAYNNAAAKELRERMVLRSNAVGMSLEKQPTIMTFHALGRKILKESGISTYISVFMEDPTKFEMWLSKWLENYVKSSPEAMTTFIDLMHQPINPFDIKSMAEYEAYIRDNEYRTLNGERVKGYQELLIANWLYLNGVDYEYEAPYISKRRISVGFDYRPDFYIKETSIYIEHFGIDRRGNTRPDIDSVRYNLEMKSKRELHDECGTTLIETFHYDWIENSLLKRLEKLILNAGLILNPLSDDEIFTQLKESGYLQDAAKLYLKCLQAIRVERLDEQEIMSRLKKFQIVNIKQYTELLTAIVEEYVQELNNQNRIDFDDMIIRASHQVEHNKYVPPWSNILVDEFQDISAARMEFLQTIINKSKLPCFTAVGDDWQSIYRFSGGKLELITRFEEMIGSCTTTKLQKTFRYNNSIADIAGKFVMVNPEQYIKNVTTHKKVDSPQVYLLDSLVDGKSNLEQRTLQVIKAIRKHDVSGSIAVLGRYRYLLNNTREVVKQKGLSNNIKYWTFHGSKGLEADYCILIGFFQGKTGFPNQNKDEAVVEALLPILDDFPHSEERRLFYVGLTRAKKKSYIIADPMATSSFITELLSPKYNVYIGSSTFEEKYREIFKCPICTEGYFKGYKGQYGTFYKCSSNIACESKPRVCTKCGSPSLDTRGQSICNNEGCKETLKICSSCGRPMKLRDGRFGKFWGCSGYGLKEDRCKITEKY